MTITCDCGATEIISVAPGSEPVMFGDFTVSRGVRTRAWCRTCWFRQFGPSEPTIMDWLTVMQPEESKNTTGSAHGASVPAASQRAEWVGEHHRSIP